MLLLKRELRRLLCGLRIRFPLRAPLLLPLLLLLLRLPAALPRLPLAFVFVFVFVAVVARSRRIHPGALPGGLVVPVGPAGSWVEMFRPSADDRQPPPLPTTAVSVDTTAP